MKTKILQLLVDLPAIENGSEENSLHTDATEVLSPRSVSLGDNCIAGVKGYYYSDIDFSGENPKITLSDKQWEVTENEIEVGYDIGDVISIVNNSKYPDCATITAISKNVITVDKLPFDTVVNMIDKTGSVASDDYSVFVAEKPLVGDVPLGYSAFSMGEDAIALERASAAFGRLTKALGQYSFVANRQTEAAYCGSAFGHYSKALGFNSFAINYDTLAKGKNSFAAGCRTIAAGDGQVALGRYNIEDVAEKFALIIGNGTSSNPRNILTIDWEGNLWVSGDILSGKSRPITEADVNKALESFIATYTAKELVAGITSEVGVKFIYEEEDIDTFSVVVDETVIIDKTPVTEKARIASELLKAEKTRFVFYSGDEVVCIAEAKNTLPNRGLLFVTK